jgi:RND family efflux transporter MFP subunit
MKRWHWGVVAAVVALAAVGGIRAIGARRAQQEAQAALAVQRAQPTIELAQTDVVRTDTRELRRVLPISGTIKAVNSAFVKARVPGELQDLKLREGDSVQSGQVLARIERIEGQARLNQAQEQADAAKAQIDIAERQFNNNKALVDQGFISKSALDTSLNNLTAAQATHKAALAAVDLARKTLEDTVLRAPISGVISQRLAQPGERVAVDSKILEIVDLSHLELEAMLTAADSVDLRVGQEAALQVEGTARPVSARVARINPSAQPGSRSVLAYLEVADTTGLRQGLFAQGSVTLGRSSALAVPLSAVRTDRPAPYVQLVEGGKVVHRTVQMAERGDTDKETWVAVTGVPVGSQVILGHVGPLREGTLVKFTGAPPPQPSPRGGGSKSTSP